METTADGSWVGTFVAQILNIFVWFSRYQLNFGKITSNTKFLREKSSKIVLDTRVPKLLIEVILSHITRPF